MSHSISITRYPYEEPYHLRLVIGASNGRLRGQLEFYTNPDALTQIADELEVFPRFASAVHLWELGSERIEDRIACYFRFRLFTTDSAGHCAIQLRFNNNGNLPVREISEFCLFAEPTGLKRLGKLFREFAKLEHEVLHWTPSEGKLFRSREEAEQGV